MHRFTLKNTQCTCCSKWGYFTRTEKTLSARAEQWQCHQLPIALSRRGAHRTGPPTCCTEGSASSLKVAPALANPNFLQGDRCSNLSLMTVHCWLSVHNNTQPTMQNRRSDPHSRTHLSKAGRPPRSPTHHHYIRSCAHGRSCDVCRCTTPTQHTHL